MSTPLMCFTPGPGLDTAFLLSVDTPLNWRVAPSRESTKDPKTPATMLKGTQNCTADHTGCQLPPSLTTPADQRAALLGHNTSGGGTSLVTAPSTAKHSPMNRLATALQPRPTAVTPPLVPAGTFWPVVMSLGGVLLRMPTSDAQVSAQQQE
eukprot:jgi/Chrzof1/9679/Cz04g11290.t1